MKPDPTNNQQVFDFIVTKLAVQRRAAVTNGACKYRGDDGCKCAVGWLMSDSQYDSTWDEFGDPIYSGRVGTEVNPDGPATMLRARGYDLELLGYLQQAHDSAESRKAGEMTFTIWRQGFTAAASKMDLSANLAMSLFRE